jgi:hypothetical protein
LLKKTQWLPVWQSCYFKNKFKMPCNNGALHIQHPLQMPAAPIFTGNEYIIFNKKMGLKFGGQHWLKNL